MFGIFTQGQRTCSKSDFKHVVLHRLNLGKTGMEERELELIFQSNEFMQGSDIIEREDFMNVFGPAIMQAKKEILDNNAR